MGATFLLVGLGNPGPKYATTRHNAGALALEYLAGEILPAPTWRQKFKGLFTDGTWQVNDQSFTLKFLFPQTFMNVSGESVQAAAKFYQLPAENIIVLHDELDIPHAKLKLKQGGGNGGHNGLKSIDQHIGKDYWRFVLVLIILALKSWLAPMFYQNLLT